MSGTGSRSQGGARNSRRDTNLALCWREEEEVGGQEGIGVIRWRSGSLSLLPPSPPPWFLPGRWRSRAGRLLREPRSPTGRALLAGPECRDRERRPTIILTAWSRRLSKRTSGLSPRLSCRLRWVSLSTPHSTTNPSLTTPLHIPPSQHPAPAGSVPTPGVNRSTDPTEITVPSVEYPSRQQMTTLTTTPARK